MGKRMQKIDPKEIDEVYRSIEEPIFKNHRLCSIDEIMKDTGLSRRRCKKALDELILSEKLTIAYEGRGKPTLYIPIYMFEEILRAQHKPQWVENYSFNEKIKKLREIENARKEIHHYEMIERLLYGTDIPLEEAVAYSLKYLGFKDVQHHRESDSHNISFTYNGINYLLEVEGTTKKGSKDKISQLRGWIEKEVDRGTDPNKLVDIFVINYFRDRDLEERGEPLTVMP